MFFVFVVVLLTAERAGCAVSLVRLLVEHAGVGQLHVLGDGVLLDAQPCTHAQVNTYTQAHTLQSQSRIAINNSEENNRKGGRANMHTRLYA